jgi:endonuclease/exonuclease/phosphatase family metal-dependent hydrolase
MLKNTIDLSSCIIGGDFNTHLNSGEKKGGSKIRDPFSENLIDLISDWDLQDVKSSKGKYTWNNRCSGLCHIAARLDRFLINNNFLLSPQEISSHILPSVVSDHKPISLNFNNPELWPSSLPL